jgi:hypothetical protein
MKRYKHTQIGYLGLTTLGPALVLVAGLLFVNGFSWITFVILILLGVALWTLAALTVTINERQLEVRFGLGLFRKAIPVPEIVTHRAVRNPWYYGWGIRPILGGWLFNVSGFWAVELQMNKGKRYRIGTDDVAGLRAALEESRRSERP